MKIYNNLYTHKKNLLTQLCKSSSYPHVPWSGWLRIFTDLTVLSLCSLSESITIFSLQVSPMKLECLTTGKLGNFPKLLVKWWRWASNTHSVFAFRCSSGPNPDMCVGIFMCCLEFIVKGEFLWIPEHHSSGFPWPTTSIHRAPAAGRLALEQARGSHPRPGWALNGKTLNSDEMWWMCVERVLLCSIVCIV